MTTRIPIAKPGSSTTVAPVLTVAQARALAVLRIATGFIFLWAFLDKMFGLGYATPAARPGSTAARPRRAS